MRGSRMTQCNTVWRFDILCYVLGDLGITVGYCCCVSCVRNGFKPNPVRGIGVLPQLSLCGVHTAHKIPHCHGCMAHILWKKLGGILLEFLYMLVQLYLAL
ncbi:hypothetical protein K439DRAFT_313045 [Ramaria rubella]|nr:hypothetical protein K439DRAFT_313045 [Ramaria rubella]